MYFDAIEWIRRGGALPDCPELLSDLAEVQYTFKGDRLLLEDKASVKKRLKRSPDWGDSFVQMFAEPILPKVRTYAAPQIRAEDYNPFLENRRQPAKVYNPFS
jgi:phage terminase large subunit